MGDSTISSANITLHLRALTSDKPAILLEGDIDNDEFSNNNRIVFQGDAGSDYFEMFQSYNGDIFFESSNGYSFNTCTVSVPRVNDFSTLATITALFNISPTQCTVYNSLVLPTTAKDNTCNKILTLDVNSKVKYIDKNKSYGVIENNTSNALNTTFTLINLYTAINITYSLGSILNFSMVSNGFLRYTGTDTKTFNVQYNITAISTNNNNMFSAIYYNGSQKANSISSNHLHNNSTTCITKSILIQLNTNDEV